jgi:mRNA interferase RelE/StbE
LKIESTRSDPHRFVVRLVGRTEYKLRVGDYRVIADIEENSGIIAIK